MNLQCFFSPLHETIQLHPSGRGFECPHFRLQTKCCRLPREGLDSASNLPMKMREAERKLQASHIAKEISDRNFSVSDRVSELLYLDSMAVVSTTAAIKKRSWKGSGSQRPVLAEMRWMTTANLQMSF